MVSSFLYAMLKLSKTKSSPKLFPSDCITLYVCLYLWVRKTTKDNIEVV